MTQYAVKIRNNHLELNFFVLCQTRMRPSVNLKQPSICWLLGEHLQRDCVKYNSLQQLNKQSIYQYQWFTLPSFHPTALLTWINSSVQKVNKMPRVPAASWTTQNNTYFTPLFEAESKWKRFCTVSVTQWGWYVSPPPPWLTWEESDEQHHHPSWPGVQQALDQLPDGLFALTGDLVDKQQGETDIIHSQSLHN